MKRVFIISFFTVLSVIAYPQTGGTPEQRAQRYLEGQTFNALNLTSEQKTKAQSILAAQYKALDSLSTGAPGAANDSLQRRRMAMMQAGEVKFRELMTDAQETAYNTIVQART